MKLIIFSDIHYSSQNETSSKENRKLTQYAVPIVNKLINMINNSFKPDLVVNLGDLIEDC